MAYVKVWREVKKVGASKPTKAGKPQIYVTTDKEKGIRLSGEGIEHVKVGDKIEISQPSPFGNSLYARLETIDRNIPVQTEPGQDADTKGAAEGNRPQEKTEAAAPVSTNGKVVWADYVNVARAMHAVACELEPDETGTEAHFEDRSQARAAIVNTALIALARGELDPKTVTPASLGPPLADDKIPF